MTPSELLVAAADYIDEHGHCKRAYIRGDSVCAVGAILMAWPGGDESRAPIEEAKTALREVVGPIIPWNDAPARTAQDVSAALREAAGAAS